MKTLHDVISEHYNARDDVQKKEADRDHIIKLFETKVNMFDYNPTAFFIFNFKHLEKIMSERKKFDGSIMNWLHQNMSGRFSVLRIEQATERIGSGISRLLCFQNEHDAVLFKLTWC
jgi:hypothetical protein